MSPLNLATMSLSMKKSETFFSEVPATWPREHDLLTWCQQMTPGVAAALIIQDSGFGERRCRGSVCWR
jgi:hypothetical protein